MKSVFHKKTFLKQNDLLIDHIINFNYNSDISPLVKNKKDENEQKLLDFISDKKKFKIKPYFNQKEIIDFLSSKLKGMEKMNLNDECTVGKIETRKINIDKKFFPKSKYLKNNKDSISPEKKINKKNNSRRKSKNKNNKNAKIDNNGEKNYFVDDTNLYINQIKNESFFSGKTLLNSIINEIKEK